MGHQLKTYTTKERNMYLFGMAGQNIIYNIIGASLAYYLQFTILIPAIAVGTMMAVARIWDAFMDPIMGSIVDKTRTKRGKCRPYLLYVPVPILIITVMCFLNFGFFDPSKGMFEGMNALIVVWAAFFYMIWGMTYTIGDVPLWSISALMSEDDKDRAKLLSLARIAAGVGGGIALLTIQPLSLQL
ncbi:MAG: MFS transporter, partial [Eubacteriales bacterium]